MYSNLINSAEASEDFVYLCVRVCGQCWYYWTLFATFLLRRARAMLFVTERHHPCFFFIYAGYSILAGFLSFGTVANLRRPNKNRGLYKNGCRKNQWWGVLTNRFRFMFTSFCTIRYPSDLSATQNSLFLRLEYAIFVVQWLKRNRVQKNCRFYAT